MSADERGAYVILQGREAVGLSFAEACDDLTFIEKASRYRGRSPHLASLRDYARCRMGLPPVKSRGRAPSQKPEAVPPDSAAEGICRTTERRAKLQAAPQTPSPMRLRLKQTSGLSSPHPSPSRALSLVEEFANAGAVISWPRLGWSVAHRAWGSRPRARVAGAVAVVLLPRLMATVMARGLAFTITWATNIAAAAATAFVSRLLAETAVWLTNSYHPHAIKSKP